MKNQHWSNLAPDLVRQRLIIEGTTKKIVRPDEMKSFLLELARILNNEVLSGPYAYSAHEMGYGGWIHWKTSGAHIYSYPTNKPLVTLDIYTCKRFKNKTAIKFMKTYFNLIEVVWQEIES